MANLVVESEPDIVDRIYEAALCRTNGRGCWKQSAPVRAPPTARFSCSPTMHRCAAAARRSRGLCSMNSWPAIRGNSPTACSASMHRPASFVVVDDLMSAEEIEHDPVRVKLRTIGIGPSISAAVPMPTGELVTFVFQRWLKDGACDQASIDALNGFRPHLARAGLIAARLGLERAQEAVGALEAIGLPAAVMTQRAGCLRPTGFSKPCPKPSCPPRMAAWRSPTRPPTRSCRKRSPRTGTIPSCAPFRSRRRRAARPWLSTSFRCAGTLATCFPAPTSSLPQRYRRPASWFHQPVS